MGNCTSSPRTLLTTHQTRFGKKCTFPPPIHSPLGAAAINLQCGRRASMRGVCVRARGQAWRVHTGVSVQACVHAKRVCMSSLRHHWQCRCTRSATAPHLAACLPHRKHPGHPTSPSPRWAPICFGLHSRPRINAAPSQTGNQLASSFLHLNTYRSAFRASACCARWLYY